MNVLAALEAAEGVDVITARLVDQSNREGTQIHLLHVLDPFPAAIAERLGSQERPDFDAARSEQRQRATTVLEHAAAALRRAGLVVSFSVEEGDVAGTILKEAERLAADLIIIGTHGRTGLRRVLHRSIADAIAHSASCAVEIVPLTSHGNSSR